MWDMWLEVFYNSYLATVRHTVRLSKYIPYYNHSNNKRPRRALLLPIVYFMGNRILLSCFIVRMALKSPFCLPSILLPEAMDQSGTPLRLMLRPPSFYQGPICQVWSSGLDGTWQQPKVVELGISKIANYNSSRWISQYKPGLWIQIWVRKSCDHTMQLIVANSHCNDILFYHTISKLNHLMAGLLPQNTR